MQTTIYTQGKILIKVEEILYLFEEQIYGKIVSFHRQHKNQRWKEEGKRKVNVKMKGISTSGKTVTGNLLVPGVASSVLKWIRLV